MRDIIQITDLLLRTEYLEKDLWKRSKKIQPLLLNLLIKTEVIDEALTDSLLEESLNYGKVTKVIEKLIKDLNLLVPGRIRIEEGKGEVEEDKEIPLEVIGELLCKFIIFKGKAPNVLLELSRPRALLTAESIGIKLFRSKSDYLPPSTTSTTSSPEPQDYTLSPTSSSPLDDTFFIKDLRRLIIIGVNACEREDEQEIILNFEFSAPPPLLERNDMTSSLLAYTGTGFGRMGWKGWRDVVKQLESHLTLSRPLTIEAITTSLSQIILTPPSISQNPNFNVTQTSVKLSKPHALIFAKYPSVQVTRTRSDFFLDDGSLRSDLNLGRVELEDSIASITTASVRDDASVASTAATEVDESNIEGAGALGGIVGGESRSHTVYLGIGTNMGDRVGNISKALKELESIQSINNGGGKTKVVDTSFLYESEAMYVKEQNSFLNAVVKVETTLEPPALLNLLKDVEDSLGREKTVRNGPRVIDLDILFYEDITFDSTTHGIERFPAAEGQEKIERWLKIPHASIAEREFVLRPLADLIPTFIHPILQLPISTLLSNVLLTTPSTLHRIIPLSSSLTHPLPFQTNSNTLIMAILNATPDSFSDGGENLDTSIALKNALRYIELGINILDIGGMSTRPGAEDISEEIELGRVLPLIKAIREKNGRIPISIDTFRPRVAKAAIEAGATIINDVLGGTYENMLEVMALVDVPVILMHSRGMPQTMSGLTKYEEDDIIEGVRIELEDRVKKALEKGVKRWNIIIDPGIGFAKTSKHNLILLKRLDELLHTGFLAPFPSLVGLSRKKFLGTLIGKQEAKERIWATASGVTASIAGGSDIVRIHDVKEMIDVVKVADGIYRS